MALIERKHEPTSSELRLFGVLLVAFCILLGGLSLYHTGSLIIAVMFWGAGLLVSVPYYAVPRARAMIFQAWMTAVFPIGWLISHTLLAVIFYGVITPIGLTVKLWNRDPLHQKRDSSASTYWVACPVHTDIRRYFQQF
jgi:hypothetical protein